METIFINTENNRTNEPPEFDPSLQKKLDLKNSIKTYKYVHLQKLFLL